jgi:hypothetical protein
MIGCGGGDGCGGRTPQRVAFSRFASRRWHKQGTFQKGWHFKGLPLFYMCLKKYAQLLR